MSPALPIFLTALSLTAVEPQTSTQPTLTRVDVLDRIYPDRPPQAADDTPISTPRGAAVALQFAATSQQDTSYRIVPGPIHRDDGTPLAARIRAYKLLPVHVEGNTQGSKKNRPGGKVPEGWMKSLVRPAPFDTLEVLVEADEIELAPGHTHAMLLDIEVAPNASPGLYSGSLQLSADEVRASVPFSIQVHNTILPPAPKLHCVHWFWPMPENLTSDDPPAWWSDRHWQLIRNSGRQLRRFGDDTVLTPLINGREPLIQVARTHQGTYEFDYSRFDRWVETFLDLGFDTFAGRHVVNMATDVWLLNRETGETEPLLKDPKDQQAWRQFLAVFYQSLAQHLDERGWADRYIQHQYDEPRDKERYEQLATLARTSMPEIRTIDAINSRPEVFSPLVDIHVFNLITLLRNAELAEQRRADAKAVWLYHCTSPYLPYPNRHIDRP
jgi:glycosyl hydrolase family 123